MNEEQKYVDPIEWSEKRDNQKRNPDSSEQELLRQEFNTKRKRKRNRFVEYLIIYPFLLMVLFAFIPSLINNNVETSTRASFAILGLILLSPWLIAYYLWSFSDKFKKKEFRVNSQKTSPAHKGLMILGFTIAINFAIGIILAAVYLISQPSTISSLLHLAGFLSPLVSVVLAIMLVDRKF